MTRQEMTDIVYDTLMQNRQHIQLDLDKVKDQETNSIKGRIFFDYEDMLVVISVNTIPLAGG
ncbi:hypothetical protein LCGC14_2237830 [marine sediment metagenome]|uniref:Uncharacterized protein n=1 Tax=marine sediment metagenome TaxID=412755 RepID=A0A0F9FIU2_9ZZZZ